MTASPNRPSEHDQQLLSEYLDGELTGREQEMLEHRLDRDLALRAELDSLRETVAWLHDLPRLKAPRSFTLDPQVYRRALPWWKQLFTLDTALQLSGALGAVAATILIVTAVLLGGDTSRETNIQGDQSLAEQAEADQPATGVALQITATALRRTLTAQEPGSPDGTRIGFAGEEFESTLAAQSAYYATHAPTATRLPTLTPAPLTPLTMEAIENEAGLLGADGWTGGAADSAPAPLAESPMTGDYAADSAAGAAPDSALVAPSTPLSTPTVGEALREADDEQAVQQALNEEPAVTEIPAPVEVPEVAAVPGAAESVTAESAKAEGRETTTTTERKEQTTPNRSLIVMGLILLAISGVVFAIGRRMARG